MSPTLSQGLPAMTPPGDDRRPVQPRQSTFRALMRIYPYAKTAMPRIVLGMVAALVAGLVALAIPLVLQALVDGPLSSGDSSQIWPAVIVVLALGVLEA